MEITEEGMVEAVFRGRNERFVDTYWLQGSKGDWETSLFGERDGATYNFARRRQEGRGGHTVQSIVITDQSREHYRKLVSESNRTKLLAIAQEETFDTWAAELIPAGCVSFDASQLRWQEAKREFVASGGHKPETWFTTECSKDAAIIGRGGNANGLWFDTGAWMHMVGKPKQPSYPPT